MEKTLNTGSKAFCKIDPLQKKLLFFWHIITLVDEFCVNLFQVGQFCPPPIKQLSKLSVFTTLNFLKKRTFFK